MKRKGLVLVSGGLDSAVALGLMKRQEVEIEALTFVTPFSPGFKEGTVGHSVKRSCDFFQVKLHWKYLEDSFLNIVRTPQHGYGTAVNPCIDCKILMMQTAHQLMHEWGASFLVTGEVIGERPMSQKRHQLDTIAKDSGLDGLIVRPLSGKLFPQTEPEKAGILDRSKMCAIQGRMRHEQMALAQEFGMTEYEQPAGGCILTDYHFEARYHDLVKHGSYTTRDILSLRWGRHMRIRPSVKIILGRDARENELIYRLADPHSIVIMLPDELPGPMCVVCGEPSEEDIRIAAGCVKYFSKERTKEGTLVEIRRKKDTQVQRYTAGSISETRIKDMMIQAKE